MSSKVLMALAAVSSFMITDVAAAQDGGIWAASRHRRVVPKDSVPASALPGIAPGLSVQTSDGRAVGRISEVVTSNDGSIRKVIVISPAGNQLKLSPTTLSIEGGIVTTSENRSGG